MSDYVSLGVVAKAFPAKLVRQILCQTGKESVRERALPAHVVVYYVVALALYMQVSCREVLRCLLEGLEWLSKPGLNVHVAGRSGISQARGRLGAEPMMRLHDAVVSPVAAKRTRGAWYKGRRLVSLDGSTLDVADTRANEQAFGRPGASRGSSAYPQIRFVSLVENGTHVLFGSRWEVETSLDELKTHLRGSKIVLRSKTPELVRQEFYGLMMAHFAVRGLMHEAAIAADVDPDQLSFVHAVRVIRRKLPLFVAIPPSQEKSIS